MALYSHGNDYINVSTDNTDGKQHHLSLQIGAAYLANVNITDSFSRTLSKVECNLTNSHCLQLSPRSHLHFQTYL